MLGSSHVGGGLAWQRGEEGRKVYGRLRKLKVQMITYCISEIPYSKFSFITQTSNSELVTESLFTHNTWTKP